MAPTKLGMCLTVTAVPFAMNQAAIIKIVIFVWVFFPATAALTQGTLEKFNLDVQRIFNKHEKRRQEVPWVYALCLRVTPEGLFWVLVEPC